MTVYGQDWASYQSSTPSTRGLDFVFIKATEGTNYVNPRMASQASHARSAGLVVGFYAFLRPGNMKGQAAYFVKKAASLHGDPLWADWEDPSVSCHDKDTFIKEVIRLRGDTHRVGLYCNTNYWTTRDSTSYCGDALWIATYNGHPGHPGIQHKWLFHQYTSTPVDKNYGAFSSRSSLKAWCDKGSASPETHDSEDDDMPSAKDVAEAVWNWDGIEPLNPTKDNPRWQPENVITSMWRQIDRMERKTDAQSAVIDKLADAVGRASQFDPSALKDEIRKAIESVTVRLDAPE